MTEAAVRELRVICRIDERQARVLDGLALVRGTTRSDVMRQLIDQAGQNVFAKHEGGAVVSQTPRATLS